MEPRTTYHHGNLRQALIDAAIAIIEEKGPEAVTVAEAGKRAGVSSGAPFRHFESKTALMTAVAEIFQSELIGVMDAAALPNDPMASLRSLGLAYLRWGLEKSPRYRMYSNRNLSAFDSSERLVEGDRHLTQLVTVEFERLLGVGSEAALRTYINARALLTGLITMYCNGHFTRFELHEPPLTSIEKAWELYLQAMTPLTRV